MSIEFYKVGGWVRDKLLGQEPKDLDFAVEAESYEAMRQSILGRGGEIYLERPEFFAIRGRLPEYGAADFTLCRKDGFYSDNRRPDSVEVGNIYDDLSRRDFCCNAIAQNESGNYLDPFGGIEDIKGKVLRAVGSPRERLCEDPLRILRACRFEITKGFKMDRDLHDILMHDHLVIDLLKTVTKERVYEELKRCYLFDTRLTLMFFDYYWSIERLIFENFPIKLEPKIYEAKA